MKSTPSLHSPVFFLILLLFQVPEGYGQCAALAGPEYGTATVEVSESGCIPLSVSIRSGLRGATNIQTLFDYRGGPVIPDSLTADTARTYPKPGFYTIVQFSEKNGQKYLACTNVRVNDTLAPVVRASVCADGGVQLAFAAGQPTDYPSYQVDWGNGDTKGYPGFGQKITYRYATPGTYSIRLRGMHLPSQCRGAVTTLTFDVPDFLTPPLITEARMKSTLGVDLTVRYPQATPLLLQESEPGGPFAASGETLAAGQTTVATTVRRPGQSCFRLQPADSCLAGLVSPPVCTSTFEAEGGVESHILSWHIPYRPPGFRAVIEKDGAEWKDVSASGETGTVEDRGLICGSSACYRLVVRYAGFAFYSLEKCLAAPPGGCQAGPPFFVPDAFSPNGDGLNDVWRATGVVSPEFELTVYGPWGMAVFHTRDPGGQWDGRLDGRPLPVGPYAYAAKYLDGSGARRTKRGVVYLLR